MVDYLEGVLTAPGRCFPLVSQRDVDLFARSAGLQDTAVAAAAGFLHWTGNRRVWWVLTGLQVWASLKKLEVGSWHQIILGS